MHCTLFTQMTCDFDMKYIQNPDVLEPGGVK
jgi:hypothetical protein